MTPYEMKRVLTAFVGALHLYGEPLPTEKREPLVEAYVGDLKSMFSDAILSRMSEPGVLTGLACWTLIYEREPDEAKRREAFADGTLVLLSAPADVVCRPPIPPNNVVNFPTRRQSC